MSLPVVDGHNDLPWAIRLYHDGLDDADTTGPLPMRHTDTARLIEGGVGGQFWSVYVPAWTERPFAVTNEQIDLTIEMCHRDPRLDFVQTAAQVREARAAGRVGGMLGAEGGHSIENSLDNIRALADRGLRYMTLTHGDTIDWADSATDEARHGGLTDFGREVVTEMNRLGVLVDVSHVSADTMRDAISASRVPVIASHSNAFELAPHPRNVPDDVLRRIGETGGVVMVNFYPSFVNREAAKLSVDMFAEERALMAELGDPIAADGALADKRAALPRGTVAEVADHVEHIARVAGPKSVGIGSDFDGIEILIPGLEDVASYPNLTAELLARGWEETALRDLLGENILRVLEQAEVASELR
ncbi:MAG: membrane dipeptidase [Acidimicrobiia bacterium]|nr:membrane dipeptidase [Acidimicrobiia bacterium]